MCASSNADHQPEWVPVVFDKAEVHPGNRPQSWVLTVTGHTPRISLGCPVKLSPMTYVRQPEYWRIEVLWDRADAIFQTERPFNVSIPLDGICGTKGIEVAGATKSVRIDIELG